MRYDFAVIGAGVMGAATARALAGGGRSVLLIEQFTVGHKRGSSHGASRIFRYSYSEISYVEMAMEALPLWRELEAETGRAIVTTTGGIDGGTDLGGHVSALQKCGADLELIDGSEARMRWPGLALPADRNFLFQPDGGVIAAGLAVKSFVDGAVAKGAELLGETKVTALRQETDGVTISMGGDEATAGVVVVTAGAWAKPLLATADIDLDVRPTRETVAYFEMPEPTPTLVDWGQPSVYALSTPSQGLKVGEHIAGPDADPDSEGVPDQGSIDRLSAWVSRVFPSANPKASFAETCFYTNTDDESFVLERHGDIVVGSACSGHGFKFAPLIGRRLAEMATA